MKPKRVSVWWLCSALALAACGKTDDTEPTSNGGLPSTGGTGGTQPMGPRESGGVAGESPGEPQPACPPGGPAPGPSPLTSLESDEVNSSVRQLLPKGATEPPWLTPDTLIANAPPTAADLDRIHALAHAVALELLSGDASAEWRASCDPSKLGAEACRDELGEPLLERIYRRPLTDEDREELAEVFAQGQKLGGTFESGLRAVVEVALQGPDFLYLLEQGTGKRDGAVVQLTGYETASRLAFSLTRSPPDSELLDEASRGPFEAKVIARQAQRLLTKEENQRTLSRRLLQRWMRYEAQPDAARGLTTELAQAINEASLRFIQNVTFQGTGTFRALLTEPAVWANETLGKYYGYTLQGGGWEKVELDPALAAGVFTQPAFLVTTSHPEPSAVMRGVRMLSALLCAPPPPPPGIFQSLPPPSEGSTGRQRLEALTSPAACDGCHRNINALGFAFEHYDGVGKWRTVDGGLPIDSNGTLSMTGAQYSFADAAELMSQIAESAAGQECFTRQWLELAYRRELTEEDACTARALAQRFTERGGKVDELILDVAESDHFRYRLASELEP